MRPIRFWVGSVQVVGLVFGNRVRWKLCLSKKSERKGDSCGEVVRGTESRVCVMCGMVLASVGARMRIRK